MNIRRTLMILAMPVLVASIGLTATHQAIAQNSVSQNGQSNQRPNNGQQGNQQFGQNNQQRPPRPDFAAAATKLGVTESALKTALGVPATPPTDGQRPPRPDFASAASKLGVTEDQLVQALGVPSRPMNGGQMGGGQCNGGGDRPMPPQQQQQ